MLARVILSAFVFSFLAIASESPASEGVVVRVGTVSRDCPNCPELVAIPQLGHTEATPGRIFYATRYEITWKEYLAAIGDGVCSPIHASTRRKRPWPHPGTYPQIADAYPLTLVPPEDFACYLLWLKQRTGNDYRFPSPAEWEHLARAGTTTKYPWGDDLGFDNASVVERRTGLPDIRHYDLARLVSRYHIDREGALKSSDPRRILQSDDLWPVGSFPPNRWGLFDVIGNAEEYTAEISSECKTWAMAPAPCTFRATRGVNYLPSPKFRNAQFTLMTFRGLAQLDGGIGTVGFRLVRD